MRRLGLAALLVAGLGAAAVAVTVGGTGVVDDTGADAAPVATASAAPVLLELFTSQGCSSCPPADRLLGELSQGTDLEVPVIPLSFHVDYWNHLGWTDPFSTAEFSQRQRAYGRVLPAGRVYTPMLVVAGAEHAVGSDRTAVRRLIRQAATRPLAGSVGLDAAPGGMVAAVALSVELAADGSAPRDVYLAVYETGLVTPVGRGENARRTLANDYVVRRFDRVAELAANERRLPAKRVAVPFEADWNRANVGVAAFVQERGSMRVLAAASLSSLERPARP